MNESSVSIKQQIPFCFPLSNGMYDGVVRHLSDRFAISIFLSLAISIRLLSSYNFAAITEVPDATIKQNAKSSTQYQAPHLTRPIT